MRDFRWFTDFFNTGLGTAIKAVLLLVLAFIVAAIAKSLIVKLLSRTKLATLKGTGEGAEN